MRMRMLVTGSGGRASCTERASCIGLSQTATGGSALVCGCALGADSCTCSASLCSCTCSRTQPMVGPKSRDEAWGAQMLFQAAY